MQTPAPVRLQLFFIVSPQRPPGFAVLLATLEKNKDYQVAVVDSPSSLPAESLDSGRGAIVYVISQKNDLLELLKFDFLRKPGRHDRFKCLAWNGLPHPSIPELLRNQGCDEVVGFEVPIKSVGYKIQAALRRVELKKPSTNSKKMGASLADASKKSAIESGQISSQPPMDTRTLDCWFLKKNSDCRFIMGRWLIELYGPGPAEGEWSRIPSAKQEGEASHEIWEWRSRKPNSTFFKPETSWRFTGREPEFVWKTLKWRFVGSHATLEAFERERRVDFRFQFSKTSAVMEMRKNSEQAQALLPIIEQSLQCEVLLKNDRSRPDGSQTLDASSPRSRSPFDVSLDRVSRPGWRTHESPEASPRPANDLASNEASDAGRRRLMLERGLEAYTKRGARFRLDERDVDLIGMDDRGLHLVIAGMEQSAIERARRLILVSNHSDQAKIQETEIGVAYVSSDAYMEGSVIATFSATPESAQAVTQFSQDLAKREKDWIEFLNAVQGRAKFPEPSEVDGGFSKWAPFNLLILGDRAAHRDALERILKQLQFKPDQIRSTGNLEKAMHWASEDKFDLIFLFESAQLSRYWLATIRRAYPQALVFWICAVTSQARIGLVAEIGANGILMQPLEPLRVVGLVSWLASRGAPLGPYEQLLHEAREWRKLSQPARAIECLEKATTIDSRPSQAYQDLADIAFANGDWETARNHLKRAISGNTLHLPSIVRLAELERNQGNWAESYEWYLQALQVFPEGADRLTHAFSLAVKTGSYRDLSLLDGYAEQTNEMCDELHRHRCAALAVVGKFFLLEEGTEVGLSYLHRAASLAGEFTAPIRYAVETLILFDEVREAGRFFEYFPERVRDSTDYLYARAQWLEAQDQLDEEYESIVRKLQERGIKVRIDEVS